MILFYYKIENKEQLITMGYTVRDMDDLKISNWEIFNFFNILRKWITNKI